MAAADPTARLNTKKGTPFVLPSLYDYLVDVPDQRSSQGRRHPLPAVLSLLFAAALGGSNHAQAVSEWGRHLSRKQRNALGFSHRKTPCPSTLHEIFKELSWPHLEKQLRAWVEAIICQVLGDSDVALAADGKVLRGSLKQGSEVSNLLSVVVHGLGATLSLESVDSKTNEIPVLPELLSRLILHGRVITADALHTQRELAEAILAARAQYVMIAKMNQPELQASIIEQFSEQAREDESRSDQEPDEAETTDKGHGRQEHRRLTLVTVTDIQVDWPGVNQVFELERTTVRKRGEEPTKELVYGLTSFPRKDANAKRLLELVRGHWTIENRVHWVRDQEFDEDASQISTGAVGIVMAAARTTVITILRAHGEKCIASARRRLTRRSGECLRKIGIR